MASMLEASPCRSCASSGLNIRFNSSSLVPVTSFHVRSSSPRAGKHQPNHNPKQQLAGGFTIWKSSIWRHSRLRELGFLQVSANSKAEDPLPSEMTLENALQILGVPEGASFEEILRAKNNLLGKHSGDQELAIQVEAAYDVLLMQRLMQRRSGKVVDSSVRYADVKKTKVSSGVGGPQWLREATSKVPVSVETPSTSALGTQSAVYSGLAAWTFASGLSYDSSAVNASADVPGLPLALGFGASLYFLTKQNVKLGKAVVLTIAGLIAGSVFGGAVESWLRVDLIPVFGIGSPAVVVSEFVLVSLWLSSLYLR